MIFIIDTNIESIALTKIKYSYCSDIRPNSDPTNIQFKSANDDARRSINLYCDLLKNTILNAFIESLFLRKR